MVDKEKLLKILDDFDELLGNVTEIATIYEDEDGYCHGLVDYINVDDVKAIYYRLEKELEA